MDPDGEAVNKNNVTRYVELAGYGRGKGIPVE